MITPRENLSLFGHHKARELFLKAFHSARFPHAWIVAGPFGIGKATFAFHMARYILSGRRDGNTTFAESDPLHRRIVAQSHGDLRTITDDGKEIGVDTIRDLNSFLNQTSAEGGWRVIIIDGADSLNRNAANALLKRLEEPPHKTVFFLVTSFPGRLLSTIRSRCQLLPLASLSEEETRKVLTSQSIEISVPAQLPQGSPGRLIRLLGGEGATLCTDLQNVLQGESAASFIHKYGGEEASYALIEDVLREHLHIRLLSAIEEKRSLDRALDVYEKVQRLFDECRFAQLDRKATLTCIFANLENRAHS